MQGGCGLGFGSGFNGRFGIWAWLVWLVGKG